MVRITLRTARVAHRCDAHYYPFTIQAGAQYIEQWISPNHDVVGRGHWWRIRACRECVEHNGQPNELLLLAATVNADEERTVLEFEGVSA